MNGWDGVTEAHNGHRGEWKSNQLKDANFMELQLRSFFMTLFCENKTKQGICPLFRWGHWWSVIPPLFFALTSAALSPGSNGMAPPLCLPSPTLGKWGSVCLLFWKALGPVYHCQSTETHRNSSMWWGGAVVQSVLLWALQPQAPRGEYPALDPYISISAFRAPTTFVSAHSSRQDMCLRC